MFPTMRNSSDLAAVVTRVVYREGALAAVAMSTVSAARDMPRGDCGAWVCGRRDGAHCLSQTPSELYNEKPEPICVKFMDMKRRDDR